MFFAIAGFAQEAFRVSLAGQAAAEARERSLANQRFNMMLGPVGLRFTSQFDIEANDNVRFESEDENGDIILRPQLNMQAVWRATQKNTLTFGAGFGYLFYLNGTEPNSFYVTPGTDLSFDVYIKDFVVNLHNRFSYTPDVSDQPNVSGVGSLNTLENTSGVGVTWDLNKAVVNFGYDHTIYRVLTEGFERNNRSLDLVNLRGGLLLDPTTIAGLQVSGGITDYESSELQDSWHVAAGPFYSKQLSGYLTFRIAAGYAAYFFSDPAMIVITNTTSEASAFYGDLSLRHRLNAAYSHSLSAGRLLQAGSFSETLDLIYVRYEADWDLFLDTSFHYSLSYEHFSEVLRESREGDRYGFSVGFSRRLTQKMTGGLNYHFYWRTSTLSSEDYVQNRLVLRLAYSF
jgi:hypothetical protein